MSDYWTDAVSEALEDAGITATEKQIETVASWMESAHDNYGGAHGHYEIPNPLAQENTALQRALKAERDKVQCRTCCGRGSITTPGPYHSSTSECHKCRGEGRHAP